MCLCIVIAVIVALLIIVVKLSSEGFENLNYPNIHYKANALKLMESKFKSGTDTLKMARKADPDLDVAEYFDVRKECRTKAGCTVKEIMNVID